MIPSSLSASALNVAESCMSRYAAENFNRSKGMGGSAASLGTSVHGALELFVKNVVMPGNTANYNLTYLMDMYRLSYMDTFKTVDTSGDIFDDGVEMLMRWFARQDFSKFTVLSCEIKENFPVKTSAGDIPFNFIWDRHDQLGPNEYKVVDYKTNRWGLSPQDLHKKIQARCYGLAAQIKYPNAERIWVEFDMLRHDPVGIVYSREDNIATWKFIKDLAEKIIATPAEHAEETLNAECRFCVKKLTCGALQKNISAGGVFSVATASSAIDLRAAFDFQIKGINAAIAELDQIILTEAREKDILEFESEYNKLTIGVSSQRAIDPERVEMVIGPALFAKYGGKSFAVGAFDKIIKSKDLTDEQKAQLKGLIYKKKGEPRVSVQSKNSLDED